MPTGKTLIVGIGNMLCCDEGVGVQVIQQMEFMELPGHIELLDMGTSTMDLITHLEGVKKLIVINAMKTGGSPGEIHKFKPEDLMPKGEEPISLHEVNLLETLTMAKQMGMEIDTVIIGVEPKVIDWGLELSDEVKKKIPAIIEAVLKESQIEGEAG
jgi:hydrogenase maturation protease